MKHRSRRMQFLAALLLCGLLLAAKYLGNDPAKTFQPWLFGPEDNAVTQAFSALSSSLEQGDSLGQAFQAFCGEMSGIEIS